jgi:hypothetical protein
MRLYAYQIPYSWYLIDPIYNNTCFWITNGNDNVTITMPSGNYTSSVFVTELTNAFTAAGFSFPLGSPVTYDEKKGKITLNLLGGKIDKTTKIDHVEKTYRFTITENTIITFFDFTATLQCNVNCVNNNNYLNQTLGWLMGYRVPYEAVDPSGNEATSVLDLIGTKYLILVVDDYNQNHVNNSLVSITEYTSTLKVPSYYSRDMPSTCITPSTTNLSNVINEANATSLLSGESNITDNGLLIAGKAAANFTTTKVVLPSAPRTLTQAQIYTINEINKLMQNNVNLKMLTPDSLDITGTDYLGFKWFV